MFNLGWWRLAVGGWWRLAVGGCWQLVVGGVVDDWWLVAVGGWRLAVGHRWWLAAVGGWRLVVGGGWWLAVGGPLGRSLRAVLNKKKNTNVCHTDAIDGLELTSHTTNPAACQQGPHQRVGLSGRAKPGEYRGAGTLDTTPGGHEALPSTTSGQLGAARRAVAYSARRQRVQGKWGDLQFDGDVRPRVPGGPEGK